MARPKTLGPKLFTLEEAEALLSLVTDRLARGQELLQQFESVRKDLAVLRLVSASGGTGKNPDRNALSEKESEEAALVAEIRRVETDLLESGCVPKSIAEGLVDFFALKDGRLVFLCWKQGEEHIEAWHTLEGGFAGRMPITSFLRGKAASE
ncbi:MAG TPA: DUF2203 domain-containing protein [Candidatus Eisenbacteria bacterium]|nr:DUF2203 domain-containing protein [Candidatus Eisenbacteria bacterium]